MPSDEVVSLFTELAALPSPPGEERVVADRVTAYLRHLGLDVSEDDAGPKIGSDTGNLYTRLEPSDETGTPLFFCAHLDTVPPEGAIEPVLDRKTGVLQVKGVWWEPGVKPASLQRPLRDLARFVGAKWIE